MFDPMPTTDTKVVVSIRNRVYKVVNVKELDAGALNPAFAAIVIAGTLFGRQMTFDRVRSYYNPTIDKTVNNVEDSLTTTMVPPPVPFELREIDGSSVLAQDLRLIVPAEVLGMVDVVAYDMQLRA